MSGQAIRVVTTGLKRLIRCAFKYVTLTHVRAVFEGLPCFAFRSFRLAACHVSFSKHSRIEEPQAVSLSVDIRKAVSLIVLLLATRRGLLLLLFAKGLYGTVDASNKLNKSRR